MPELQLNAIVEAWVNKFTLDFDDRKEMFNLYIDNPFCSKKCRFCCYMPTILNKKNQSKFDEYYSELLPQCINDYSEVLNAKTPNSVYFGGGTSSLMNINQMERIFNLLDQKFDFKNGPTEKTFEMNPQDITEEQIKLLSEWNFTHVTMGIQSFNSDILKYNNRERTSLESTIKIANYLEKYQIMYNMDIMVFIHKGDLQYDMEAFTNDLNIMATEVKPLHITIYPNYFFIDPPKNRDKMLLSVTMLRSVISEYLDNNEDYTESGDLSKRIDKGSILETYRYSHSLLRNDVVGKKHWKRYSCSGWPNDNEHQNVLGIGGFGKRKTYSYFGSKFCYQAVATPSEQTFQLVYADSNY